MPDAPEHDPLDQGRAALEEVAPTTDLWAEASRRSAGLAATPLAIVTNAGRRGVWLAVAAILAVVVGTVGVLSLGDDQSADTPPATSSDGPATSISGGGADQCGFGLSGDPILLDEGPADPPLFEPAAQPDLQTIAHVALGTTQVAEIHVPGLVVIDLVGERVEDIELRRGTAQVWFGPDFVQVRWFPGGQDPCGSFTVTVAGGTEDGNRHAAVDLADRILLPAELAGGNGAADATDLLEGDWLLERSSVGGTPTEGGGLTFAFHGGDASWTDGCNTSTGRYEAVGEEAVRMDGVEGTRLPCPSNPTAQAVQWVMGAEQIQVSVGGDLLLLAVDDHRLTLRPG